MKNKFFNLFSTKNNFNENNEEELSTTLLFITSTIDNMGKYSASKSSNSKLRANKKNNAYLLNLYYDYASKDESNFRFFKSIKGEFKNLIKYIFLVALYIIATVYVFPLIVSYFYK